MYVVVRQMPKIYIMYMFFIVLFFEFDRYSYLVDNLSNAYFTSFTGLLYIIVQICLFYLFFQKII